MLCVGTLELFSINPYCEEEVTTAILTASLRLEWCYGKVHIWEDLSAVETDDLQTHFPLLTIFSDYVLV